MLCWSISETLKQRKYKYAAASPIQFLHKFLYFVYIPNPFINANFSKVHPKRDFGFITTVHCLYIYTIIYEEVYKDKPSLGLFRTYCCQFSLKTSKNHFEISDTLNSSQHSAI